MQNTTLKNKDIFIDGENAFIYPKGEIPTCGFLPDEVNIPKTIPSDSEELEDRDYDTCRVFRRMGVFPAKYIEDLRKKAQELMDELVELGLEIDHTDGDSTYRRSAAWKDQPTYYTFHQHLKTNDPDKARRTLFMLYGMSDGVYELGLNLCFTKEFKIEVFGTNYEWVKED